MALLSIRLLNILNESGIYLLIIENSFIDFFISLLFCYQYIPPFYYVVIISNLLLL